MEWKGWAWYYKREKELKKIARPVGSHEQVQAWKELVKLHKLADMQHEKNVIENLDKQIEEFGKDYPSMRKQWEEQKRLHKERLEHYHKELAKNQPAYTHTKSKRKHTNKPVIAPVITPKNVIHKPKPLPAPAPMPQPKQQENELISALKNGNKMVIVGGLVLLGVGWYILTKK